MKPQKFLFSFLFMAGITMIGCKKDDVKLTPPAPNMDELYANSVTDALYASVQEQIDTLSPIKADNPLLQWKTINGQSYVLLATFMRFPGSYPAGDSITNSWGESWLFIPAQMKRRIGGTFKPGSDTTMRLCQLLGLPPVNSRSNTHIAEIWVNAQKLFRPAGNPDITKTAASAVLANDATPTYSGWFNSYIIFAYYRPLQPADDFHYPWTRLGYTYDWAPDAKKVGLSEYVLQANSGIWVEKVSKVADYFK